LFYADSIEGLPLHDSILGKVATRWVVYNITLFRESAYFKNWNLVRFGELYSPRETQATNLESHRYQLCAWHLNWRFPHGCHSMLIKCGSDMSRWAFIHRDSMQMTLQNKEGVKLGPINSGQIYEKIQRYATYITSSCFTGYSVVRCSP